jgi:hypothetical protein
VGVNTGSRSDPKYALAGLIAQSFGGVTFEVRNTKEVQMKHFIVASLFTIVSGGVQAAEPNTRVPVLAELFTSEGCSSCPPADALLRKLDQLQPVANAQIIVLSEHVDYWNSLGWKDPFSSAQFTDRQALYAHALNGDTFTPQLAVDGRWLVLGSDQKAVESAIARAAAKPKSAVRIVSATRDGNEAVIGVAVDALAAGKKDVWVAIADDRDETNVRKGENAGRTMIHVSVVRSLGKAGTVTKSAGFEKTVRVPLNAPVAEMRVVVFVAESGGPVLGLAMQRLQ